MGSSTIYPESSISSRSSNHQSSSGRSQAPSHTSSRRSSSSNHSSSSRRSSGSAQTSAYRSEEFVRAERHGGSGSTVSRSSSHRSYDPTVHPASSSGRAHSEASNNRAMVTYTGSSSSSSCDGSEATIRGPSSRAPSQASRSSSQRSHSSSGSRSSSSSLSRTHSDSGSHRSSSSGRVVARMDSGGMGCAIHEHRHKTLKDASFEELIEEAVNKLQPVVYTCYCGHCFCSCPRYY